MGSVVGDNRRVCIPSAAAAGVTNGGQRELNLLPSASPRPTRSPSGGKPWRDRNHDHDSDEDDDDDFDEWMEALAIAAAFCGGVVVGWLVPRPALRRHCVRYAGSVRQ